MNKDELIDQLATMQEVFPRLNTNPGVVPFWYNLARQYSIGQWERAFERYVSTSDSAPGIASMKAQLDTLYGAAKGSNSRDKYKAKPYTRIDFLMDVLSPATVSEEIRKCHPSLQGEVSWSSLVGAKDWVGHYKERESHLMGLALERFREDGPPKKRFWKDELLERDWDLIGEPKFDKRGRCVNQIDRSGEFYREWRERQHTPDPIKNADSPSHWTDTNNS